MPVNTPNSRGMIIRVRRTGARDEYRHKRGYERGDQADIQVKPELRAEHLLHRDGQRLHYPQAAPLKIHRRGADKIHAAQQAYRGQQQRTQQRAHAGH